MTTVIFEGLEPLGSDIEVIPQPAIDIEAAKTIGWLAVGNVNYDCAVGTSAGAMNRASILTGDGPFAPGEKKTPGDPSLEGRREFLRLLGPLRRECISCDPELNRLCEDRTVAGNINNIVRYLVANGQAAGAVSAHSRHFNFGEGVQDFSVTTPRTTSNLVMTARPGEKPYDRGIRRGLKFTDESIADRTDELMRVAPELRCTVISSCPHPDKVLASSVESRVPVVAYSPGQPELKDMTQKSRTLRQLYERKAAGLRTIIGLNNEEYRSLFGDLRVEDVMAIYVDDLAITDGEVGSEFLHRDPDTGEISHLSFRNAGFVQNEILDPELLADTERQHRTHVLAGGERLFYLSSVGAGDRFFATLTLDLMKFATNQGKELSLDNIQQMVAHADQEAKKCLGHKGATCDLTGGCSCDHMRSQWERAQAQ